MRDHLRSSVETLGGSPLWLARFAGVGVLIAALVVGVNVTIQAESDAVWLFLLWATTPLAIGVLVLVATEAMRGYDPDGHAVVLGRAAGTLLIIASLAVAIRFGVEAAGSAWSLVLTTSTQLGLGFLVLVLTEAVRRETDQDSVLSWGRLFGGVVILAALASGLRVAFQSTDGEVVAFLETVTKPIGVGLIVVVSAEAIRGGIRHRSESDQDLEFS